MSSPEACIYCDNPALERSNFCADHHAALEEAARKREELAGEVRELLDENP